MNKLAFFLICGFAGVFATGCTVLTSAKKLELNEKEVVLTFDDSPNPHFDTTKKLLDVLEKHNVKGYFCVLGVYAEQNPELIRMINSRGHVLVNHSYKHDNLVFKNYEGIRSDLERCDEAVSAALGYTDFKMRYVRPPYGMLSKALEEYCNDSGRALLPVSHCPVDFFFGPGGKGLIVNMVVDDVVRQNGGVIVLHDRVYAEKGIEKAFTKKNTLFDRSWIPQAVDEIITRLKAEGFSFVGYERAERTLMK